MEFKFVLLQLVTPAIGIALFGPVVLYLVARWRAHREPTNDPQLGFKFALHYFASVAFHLALAGGTLLIYTMIKPGDSDERLGLHGDPMPSHDGKGEMYRLAFGFLLPAA